MHLLHNTVPSSGTHACALRAECRRALAQAGANPNGLRWAVGALAQGRLEDVARWLLAQVRGKQADISAARRQRDGGLDAGPMFVYTVH